MHQSRSAQRALVLLLLAAGCEPALPSDSAIRTDSAGVLLVAYPHLPPLEASRIAIATEPDLVLGEGSVRLGPDYEFFGISGVAQLRDGTIVVASHGSRELRYYGADGRFLRSVGRNGDGPGEFRSVRRLWIMAGDTSVVWDQVARRLQHFSPDGTFVRSTSVMTAPFAAFSGLPAQPQGVFENGGVVVFLETRSPGSHGVPQRQPLLVALHRIQQGGWDSVRVVPGTEQIFGPDPDGRGAVTFSYAFGAYAVAAAAGATLAVADPARFHIELFDPAGRPVSILSAAVPGIPVTAEVIEALIGHLMKTVVGADDEYSRMLRSAFSARHAPFLPAIRAVFVDADERIWVERYDIPGSGPSRWEVFERNGTWVGRVEMPEGLARGMSDGRSAPGFSITAGRLAGVWTDSDTGVETVRVYRVIEPES
jgi:hypothetical protein